MNGIYDLVRRSDGKTVASFPNDGRWQVFTKAGVSSVRPLLDDEVLITPAGMIQFLQRLGYRVTNS
nr:hypothetical protein [Enterobacter hormaechei]